MTDIAEHKVRWDGVAGAPYWSTFRAFGTGSLTTEVFNKEVEEFIQALLGNVTTAITAVGITDVPIIDSATGNLVGADTVPAWTHPGTAAGEALPRTTQALLQWNTGVVVAGRRLRGRLFVPGMTEAQNVAGGVPNPVLITGMNAAIASFLSSVASNFLIYTRTHHTFAPVTGGQMWSQWATLRSRRD